MLTQRHDDGDSSPAEHGTAGEERPVAREETSAAGASTGTAGRVLRWVLSMVAVAVLVAGAAVTFANARVPEARVDPGEEVVATVDGEPVYGLDVGPHIRTEAPWVGVQPPADPVDSALRDAVIVRLLAAEARRQGLSADSNGARSVVDGQLNLALLDKEMDARGHHPEKLTEPEVHAFYQDNLDRLSRFRSGTVSAVILTDLDRAREVLARAAVADDTAFAALVAQHSTDPASRAKGGLVAEVDAAADEVPLPVARVVVWTRRNGDVGLAETGDGRFWVIRMTKIELLPPPWNAATEQRVRELMANEWRGEVMRDLEARLRPAADVKINKGALDRYRAEVGNDLVPTARVTAPR
ncbi:peptidylprolyl isomerase [Plantactinospora sp. WMMB334]|uniref:peptidylprolyl isomerase n=1 Tax=Plantactinospora sp. WMMB334 TaxID=3404119 RepID=UPI003B9424F9